MLKLRCFCFVPSCQKELQCPSRMDRALLHFWHFKYSSTKGSFAFLILGRTAQKTRKENENTNISCSAHHIWAVVCELDLVFPAKCVIYLCHNGAALGGGILGKHCWLWQVAHEPQDDNPHDERSL